MDFKQQQKIVDHAGQLVDLQKKIDWLKDHIKNVRSLRNKWKGIQGNDLAVLLGPPPEQLSFFSAAGSIPVVASFITTAMVKEYLKAADLKLRRLEHQLQCTKKKFA